jgi:hypothetical protein
VRNKTVLTGTQKAMGILLTILSGSEPVTNLSRWCDETFRTVYRTAEELQRQHEMIVYKCSGK